RRDAHRRATRAPRRLRACAVPARRAPRALPLIAMRVSIVVPAFNEEKLIAQSLAAIRAASAAFAQRGWDVELIVCDNHSTDATAALARQAGTSVVLHALTQISR